MAQPLEPLHGDFDVGVGDTRVLLEDTAGFSGGVGPEIIICVTGEVRTCDGKERKVSSGGGDGDGVRWCGEKEVLVWR